MARPERAPTELTRRELLKSGVAVGALAAFAQVRVGGAAGHVDVATSGGSAYLRPPGAVAEPDLLARCIRCHKCGESCANGAIRFVGPEGPAAARGTPYLVPREKGCVLCMRCGQGCPSGALRPLDADHPRLWEVVGMGTAEVDEAICHSFNGFVCGVCVRACPLAGVALTAEVWERPKVHPDRCVGCGLCEQACYHMPQAIRVRVRPRRGASRRAA